MTTQVDTPAALTPRDLAVRWSVHPITVYKLAQSGKIPQPFRVGTNLRWHLSTIEAYESLPQKVVATTE